MIKATVRALSSPGLQMALQKLVGAQVNLQSASRFKKVHTKFEQVMKKTRDQYTIEVAKKFGALDEKGEIIPEQCPWGYKLREGVSQEEFDKANDAFHDKEVDIDVNPLTYGDLNRVDKISATELSALEVFVIEPPEGEEIGNVAQMVRR